MKQCTLASHWVPVSVGAALVSPGLPEINQVDYNHMDYMNIFICAHMIMEV